jgi:hypothetical protein
MRESTRVHNEWLYRFDINAKLFFFKYDRLDTYLLCVCMYMCVHVCTFRLFLFSFF